MPNQPEWQPVLPRVVANPRMPREAEMRHVIGIRVLQGKASSAVQWAVKTQWFLVSPDKSKILLDFTYPMIMN